MQSLSHIKPVASRRIVLDTLRSRAGSTPLDEKHFRIQTTLRDAGHIYEDRIDPCKHHVFFYIGAGRAAVMRNTDASLSMKERRDIILKSQDRDARVVAVPQSLEAFGRVISVKGKPVLLSLEDNLAVTDMLATALGPGYKTAPINLVTDTIMRETGLRVHHIQHPKNAFGAFNTREDEALFHAAREALGFPIEKMPNALL